MTAELYGSPNRFIADGQSLNSIGFGGAWINLLAADLKIPFSNPSIGSCAWEDLLARMPQEWPKLAPLAQRTIYSLGIGGQSNLLNGDNGSTIYGHLVSYAAAVRAAWATYNPSGSIKIIGLTITPSGFYSTPQNNARLDANAAILADASDAFDATVDITTAPLDDPTNTLYYQTATDLHLTFAGATEVFNKTKPTVASQMI